VEGIVQGISTEFGRRCRELGIVFLVVSTLHINNRLDRRAKRRKDLSLMPSYNMIKKQMQGGDPSYRTSSGQHLLAAAEASQSESLPATV
jgi:hypothetical protein